MRTVVVSGLSGAGKSSAVKTMENLGFYCIDNLPVPLLRPFLELSTYSSEGIQKLALVIDARDARHIERLPEEIKTLKSEGYAIELAFLEASDEVLARRFSETRQKHPLSLEGSVHEGIKKERALLGTVRRLATVVIDTTDLKARDLKHELSRVYGTAQAKTMAVNVLTFGFKNGLPVDADLVLDARFLSNPFFREDLKSRTGLDPKVMEFVLNQDDSKGFLAEIARFLTFLLPRFEREGKSYLTIAIGCTGGRHRSVVIGGQVTAMIEAMGHSVSLQHRDLEKE